MASLPYDGLVDSAANNRAEKCSTIGIMPVIEDQITTPPADIMPVLQVIEAQRARSWCLTTTSLTTMSARSVRGRLSLWHTYGTSGCPGIPYAPEERLNVLLRK